MAGVYYTFAVAPFIRESGILAYKIRLQIKNTIFRQAYFIRYIGVSTFAYYLGGRVSYRILYALWYVLYAYAFYIVRYIVHGPEA